MGNANALRRQALVGRVADAPLRDVRYLAFGCGSIRGLALIAAYFTLLHEVPNISVKIRAVSGCSVGALMCLAVWLGLSFEEMLRFQSHMLSRSFGEKLVLQRDCNRFSLWDSSELRAAVERLMVAKGVSPNTTFGDLAREGACSMHIVSYNIDKSAPTVFDRETTPHVRVLDAVCASCAIPFVFTPQRIARQCYVDGAVSNELPLYVFGEENLPYTLGFYLFDRQRNHAIGRAFFAKLQNANNVISIDVTKMSFLEMRPTQQLIEHILAQGRNAVLTYYGV